ncbi:XRE family transcriptional regulator [Streptomyces iranensis]|uniref:XRE family transcriptional regulator n=2 Tax=Streptomyces iranensis TaxID=576784 RepID=A0A060ZMF2_9ACTN|nr:XRE family transcriptional regulator [Streptomyces iranensis]
MTGYAVTMTGGDFAQTVSAALKARGMSIRGAARELVYDHAYLCRVLAGKQLPSPQLAEALDRLLDAGGELVNLAASLAEDEGGRVAYAIDHPSRIDGRAVKTLGDILAAQRRLDDTLGPSPLIGPVEAQTATLLSLLKDVRGPHRDALAEVAAESVQFAGWLYASTRQDAKAVKRLTEAEELADEAGSGTLAAQALNFRGYIARQQGNPRGMVRWFSAAYYTPGASAPQRMGDAAQVAQGLGELGQTDAARRLLDEAMALSDAAQDQPPGTAYWLTPNFQRLNLGLAHLGLKAYADAADHIRAGLAGLPADQQRAPWTKEHRDALAQAEAHC